MQFSIWGSSSTPNEMTRNEVHRSTLVITNCRCDKDSTLTFLDVLRFAPDCVKNLIPVREHLEQVFKLSEGVYVVREM